jgi:lipoprotein-releasing system permease protein
MAISRSIVPTLARNFLLSKSSDGFISFIAWVSVVGVALGVLALTVVTSTINGFEGELSRVITGTNGDVMLYSRGEPIHDPADVEKKIKTIVPEVQAITSTFTTQLMASGPSSVAGAVLEGVDFETSGDVTNLPRQLIRGRMPEKEGEYAIGSALADQIGASTASPIRLIIPFSGDSDDVSASPKVIKGDVVGIVKIGLYEYDSTFIFGRLEDVQHILNEPGSVTTFKMKLSPKVDAAQVSDRLADHFGYPFRAKDWMQMNKNLFYAIRLEKVVIGIILTVIVIVAAFNVVSTLMMMIHDKTKEIAILKTMGFRPAQSFKLFCLIGFGMGVVGTLLGVGMGLGVDWVLARTKLISLPADIYYIGFLPVVVRWNEIIMIALLSLLIAFVATLFPAWQVSRRAPLDGLRYE